MLFWTLHRRSLVQSWLNYAWRSLHQNLFSSVLFWDGWDGNLVCLCCVWGSCELPEGYHHSWEVTVGCAIVMEHFWWDHRASFPSLPLAYGFAAEKQSTSVNKYFVMCLGTRGIWKPQLTFSPEHEKLRCPLLKWWRTSPCCHMRFHFMAFPGTLKQGIDTLVSPVSASSQGENDKMMFLSIGLVMQWHPAVTMWMVQSLLRSKTPPDADFHGKPWLGSSVKVGQATALSEGGKGKL